MKTALTVWANRISPVFDAAGTLLIVEIRNSEIQSRQYESFDPDRPSHLAAKLMQMHVSTLICGAISQRPAMLLEAGGIKLIPFITGRAEKVLHAYAREMPITPGFQMPGCRRRRHRQEDLKNRSDIYCRNNKEVMKMPGKDQTGPQGQGAGTGRGQGGCKSGKGGGKASNTGQGKGCRRGQGAGQGQGQGRGRGRRNNA